MVNSKQTMEINEESAVTVPGRTLFKLKNLLRSLLKVVPPEILSYSLSLFLFFSFFVAAYVDPSNSLLFLQCLCQSPSLFLFLFSPIYISPLKT